MPAKDIYHDLVKEALESEKWIITHENMKIGFGGKKFYVDLGTEKIIAAEKNNIKI